MIVKLTINIMKKLEMVKKKKLIFIDDNNLILSYFSLTVCFAMTVQVIIFTLKPENDYLFAINIKKMYIRGIHF